MVIGITYHCNLQCPHCLFCCDDTGEHGSFETFAKAIEFFKESKAKFLMISGGEPTTHPEFFRFLKYALEQCQHAAITLITNGNFLKHEMFSKRLAAMQKKHKFFIQVTSVKGLYSDYEDTVKLFYKRIKLFKRKKTLHINRMTAIDQVGRAKGKDFSYLGPLYKRQAPLCWNLFNMAKFKEHRKYKFGSFQEIINYLETQTEFNKCRPIIDAKGNIFPGEYNICISPGKVGDVTCSDMFDFLREKKPCLKCGKDFLYT